MSDTAFHELRETGLISAEGEDAVAFLHAQLTSDVAGLAVAGTQYSGYCSPKGRLLATLLVWRLPDRVFLQLPLALSEPIHARLTKYVLRAKVKLAHEKSRWTVFGVSGPDSAALLAPLVGGCPIGLHEVATAPDVAVTRVSPARYLIVASAAQAATVRTTLQAAAREQSDGTWAQLDIDAGIPWIGQATQDEYIPQMLNLDLIGAVSYSKGCYPGQEIVARTHYLGRVKQRMHRIRIPDEGAPATGDPLYSALLGTGQACGTVLNVAPRAEGGIGALAVIHTAALGGESLHWKRPDGPVVELLSLPYAVPA